MKVVHYTEIPPIEMNNDIVKNVAGRVLLGSEDGTPNFCMRRFDLGPGGYAPRHSHDWEHEIYVLEGRGQVLIHDTVHDIKAGSAVLVPPNAEHQVKNASDANFAFLCLVPSGAPEM